MERTTLTQLLDLPEYKVNQVIIDKELTFILEKKDYPICPKCGQLYDKATKDKRDCIVEDLSVFGKKCFLKFYKYRISCSCGYNGTEKIPWLKPYAKFTNRYTKWIYAFCKRMTCLDVFYKKSKY